MKNCEFLITDSHHGTCLGILFKKNYFAIGNKKRGIDRFITVAEKLGTLDRIISLPVNEKLVDQLPEIDYADVEIRLNQEVDRAKSWLEMAFNKESIPGEETVYTLLRRIEKLEEQVRKLQG